MPVTTQPHLYEWIILFFLLLIANPSRPCIFLFLFQLARQLPSRRDGAEVKILIVVARQEHVTLPDTETHSRLEIETLLFNAIRYHAIRSLNFAVAFMYLKVLCVHLPRYVSVRSHHDSQLTREERRSLCWDETRGERRGLHWQSFSSPWSRWPLA